MRERAWGFSELSERHRRPSFDCHAADMANGSIDPLQAKKGGCSWLVLARLDLRGPNGQPGASCPRWTTTSASTLLCCGVGLT